MEDLKRGIKLFNGSQENLYIDIQKATRQFKYSGQYLRKLLRNEKLFGIKIGQVWLIAYDSLLEYIKKATKINDFRFGTKVKKDEGKTN